MYFFFNTASVTNIPHKRPTHKKGKREKNTCWHHMTCCPHRLPININISPGCYLGHLHPVISGCPLLSRRSLVTSSKDTFGARLSHPLLPPFSLPSFFNICTCCSLLPVYSERLRARCLATAFNIANN